MNSKTQEKLARITQIQQDIYSLEKELDVLLGTSAPRQAPVSHGRPKVSALRNAEESRESLRSLILDLARSTRSFSPNDVFSLAQSSKIDTSKMQVAQLCNWLAKRGQLELIGMTNGVKSYSLVVGN